MWIEFRTEVIYLVRFKSRSLESGLAVKLPAYNCRCQTPDIKGQITNTINNKLGKRFDNLKLCIRKALSSLQISKAGYLWLIIFRELTITVTFYLIYKRDVPVD